ncbi:GNAT family N-acetyltransferase [Defluviitalea phaphyphila]|uniref:GNAT family N-acetyltransferase n=1 Tax=Defluviitalea phaphyphila TaxID=1473580 RepID=UPI0007313345|nr:GNAT family protein [Defluviitalea phaphyphila]
MKDYNKIIRENSTMESNRLILRPFSMKDVQDVFLYASDDIVTKYLTWPSHIDISQTEKVVKEFYMTKSGVFAIELKSEHKCIGCIELRVCPEHDKASFGYVLNREYWNKGYMTEALKLILDFAFSRLGLNRIEATHYVGNEGSGRVMQKCGMKYEGKGLQEVKIKGIFHDVVHYAILREDWINSY